MESDDELPPDQQGTNVFTDVLEADEGSLFPLQGALGYDIAQTLFIGPNCLIVEGVSDLPLPVDYVRRAGQPATHWPFRCLDHYALSVDPRR